MENFIRVWWGPTSVALAALAALAGYSLLQRIKEEARVVAKAVVEEHERASDRAFEQWVESHDAMVNEVRDQINGKIQRVEEGQKELAHEMREERKKTEDYREAVLSKLRDLQVEVLRRKT